MATFRSPYANSSSQHLPTYPPSTEQISDEDYKIPYDEDIIDTYARDDDFPPRHSQLQVHPAGTPYLSPHQRPPSWQPPYPLPQKHSYSSERTGTETEFATHEGSREETFPLPLSKEKNESRGFWTTIIPDSIACRLYVLTVLIETTIDIAIEADLFVRFNHSEDGTELGPQRLPVYLSIFAFAHVFQLLMAIDAVYARNTLQFLFLTIFNALFLLYAVLQIFEIRQSVTTSVAGTGISDIPLNVLTTVIPIVISVAEIAYIALGWRIWSEFGWKVYKTLGADRRVKRMFAHYQIFICLVKFDVFFFIGFSVQVILLVLQSHNWEWYVTCAALPLSFLLLLEGHLAATRENKFLMGSFMVGCIGAMVYFVYKLFKIIRDRAQLPDTFHTLAVFAVIAILLLVATFVVACLVIHNFGAGLKQQMLKARKAQSQPLRRRGTEHQQRQSVYPMSVNPNRMSID